MLESAVDVRGAGDWDSSLKRVSAMAGTGSPRVVTRAAARCNILPGNCASCCFGCCDLPLAGDVDPGLSVSSELGLGFDLCIVGVCGGQGGAV